MRKRLMFGGYHRTMPARSLGNGTISFGMVSSPVNLFTDAESAATISFNLLDGKTKQRLKQKYIRKDENDQDVEVPRAEMVKGYEFAKDQYVTFTNEEIKS